ncbi:5'-flap endonuclease [Paraconiothyrium brasiliense]|uniref:Structure-specific endonuclease subunit SLX4 n=1 Tax=Paraconiothyrium brasiliense TaxID=300254 RepID=A0ABR3QWP4_9PLEO
MGVERGFATARSLLADIDINSRGLNAIEEALESTRAPTGPENTIKASKPRKRAPKTKAADAGKNAEKPKPKANPRGRKPKTTDAEQPAGDASNAGTTITTSSHFARLPATDVAASTRESVAPALELKISKPRKSRAKKATTDDSEIQSTIKKAKVTKPRATRVTKKTQEEAAGVVSAHFRPHDPGDDAVGTDQGKIIHVGTLDSRIDEASIWDVPLSPSRRKGSLKQRPADLGLPLDLDEAVSRRRNWTPPPDSLRQEVLTSSTGKENRPVQEKESFTNLVSGYSYARLDNQSEASTTKPNSTEVVGAMKRRRVELVDLPVNHGPSRQASPEKGKAPKKKPRTITDLVTGQYAPQQPQVDSPEVTSDFFARRTATVTKTIKVPLNDTGDADSTKNLKKPVRKRSTSKSASEKGEMKGKSKRVSTKTAAKPKMVAEKLLSPSSALFRLNRQELLFGTSSQLAREESPTMVREIQKAIRESEQDADLRQGLASDSVSHTPWSRFQHIEGRRALWRASSRDDDGEMLERQSIYLPQPDRTQDFPLLPPGPHDRSDDSFLNINDFAPPPEVPIAISSDLPTPPSSVAQDSSRANVVSTTNSSPFKDIDDFSRGPFTVANGSGVPTEDHATKKSSLRETDDFPQGLPPSNQNVDSSFLDIDDFAPSAQASTKSFLPQLASTGSPKKPRGRPPKKQSAVPPRLPVPAPVRVPEKVPGQVQSTTATSPSTPRKNKSRFHSVEAILDSEDDEALSPTPPRTRRFEASPPLPLVFDNVPTAKTPVTEGLVPIYCVPEAKLTFDGIRPTLFPSITSLIRSLPPTSDPTKPSWHEKILMYDAIVAEDLTAFLNTHDQIRTYKRATQKQSKAWNKDLRAKGEEEMKVAEGDGMVLAVEKEIEAWMVQKWGEEMSVCCVSRERKNGGARKGLY